MIYAGSMIAVRIGTGIAGGCAVAVRATDAEHARAQVLEQALEEYPISEGWAQHRTSIAIVPNSWIRSAAADLAEGSP